MNKRDSLKTFEWWREFSQNNYNKNLENHHNNILRCLSTIIHFPGELYLYSILFYSILFYSILFYSILFYSILFYSILFYSILLYSVVLYSIVLYCILSRTEMRRLSVLLEKTDTSLLRVVLETAEELAVFSTGRKSKNGNHLWR